MEGTVSATALLIAYVRSLEATKPFDKQLFNDPFASELAGEKGRQYFESFGNLLPYREIVGVRTYYIDTFITNLLSHWSTPQNDSNEQNETKSQTAQHQVVVLGAGLDTRAWRFSKQIVQQTAWFEVDLAPIIDFKRTHRALASHQPNTFEHHYVDADVCSDELETRLQQAGFQRDLKTIWEEQLQVLFCTFFYISFCL